MYVGQQNIYPFPGLVAVDVSNPSNPTQIGHVQAPGSYDLAVSGSTVFLAAGTSGLQVVDVSSPSQPAVIGSWTNGLGTQAYGVAVAGSLVYLAYNGGGFNVLDVSNPSAPALIGSLWIPTRVLTLSGSTVICRMDIESWWWTSQIPRLPRRSALYCSLRSQDSSGNRHFDPNRSDAHGNCSRSHRATMIPFALSQSGPVTLRILDVTGREVRTLLDQVVQEGSREAKWDGRNNQGELVPTGIYFYQLRSFGASASKLQSGWFGLETDGSWFCL